ncbi:pentapeptide repeat-containing protein [Amycolatopsis sp. NPDC004747]
MKRWPDSGRRDAIGVLVVGGLLLLLGTSVAWQWVDWPALGRWTRAHSIPVALFAAAGLCLLAGARLTLRAKPRPTTTPMVKWWLIVAAAVVVIAVTWGATSLLLTKAAAAQDVAAAQVEAIKTGLGIGAGATGIFAVTLALRRQWHTEFDATEKNVTELYTKAADQLGSDKAPVRLAGLYALERLAHGNVRQRQSIVNVLCAYLRMPYELPTELGDDATDADRADRRERAQEREVRLTAQRIVCEHLHEGNREGFWAGPFDLDLTGATLINFTFVQCRARALICTRATFTGTANFFGATITDTAWFTGATFARVIFDGITVRRTAHFEGARIDEASFNVVRFGSGTSFRGAIVNGRAADEWPPDSVGFRSGPPA